MANIASENLANSGKSNSNSAEQIEYTSCGPNMAKNDGDKCTWETFYLESFGKTLIATSDSNPASFLRRTEKSEWYLKIYPLINLSETPETPKDNEDEFITLDFVSCEYPSRCVNAKCTVSIADFDSNIEFTKTVDLNAFSQGDSVLLCTVGEARHVENISLGKLRILCTLDEIEPFEIEKPVLDIATANENQVPTPTENLTNALAKMFTDQMFGDVTFIVDGRPILAHKGILVTRSPAFADILIGGKEDVEVVQIRGYSFEVFYELLRFAHTDQIPSMDDVMARALFRAADRYWQRKLRDHCEQYIYDTMTVESVSSDFYLAIKHNAPMIKTKALEMITQRGQEVKRTSGWKKLTSEHSDAVSIMFELLFLAD